MDQGMFRNTSYRGIVAAFVEAVDNEEFVLDDIADVMGIGQEEGIAILQPVMKLDPSKLGMTMVVKES